MPPRRREDWLTVDWPRGAQSWWLSHHLGSFPHLHFGGEQQHASPDKSTCEARMRIGIHLPASRLHGGRRLPPSEVPPNSRADHERMTHEKSPQRPTTNASPEPQTAPQGGQPVVSSTKTRDGLGGDGGGWAGGGACRGAAGLPPQQPRRWGLKMGRLGCSARSPNEPRVPQPTWLQAARTLPRLACRCQRGSCEPSGTG